MKEKSTSELRNELMKDADLDSYLNDNSPLFNNQSIAELLTTLYGRKTVTKAELARKANMSEVYLHQIFAGRRKPSRDRLLCLCVGLEATLDETQQLLGHSSYAQLYPKIKRDAIIIHGIIHHTDLNDINDKLFAENEKTLF